MNTTISPPDDDDNEQPQPQSPYKQQSVWGAGATLVKAIVGAGILAVPRSFAEAGVIPSVILTLALAWATAHGMKLLDLCASAIEEEHQQQRSEQPLLTTASTPIIQAPKLTSLPPLSFGGVAYAAFGDRGTRVTNFVIAIGQAGFCIAYLEYMSNTFCSLWPSHSRITYLLLITPFLFISTQFRDISFLAPMSHVANIVFFFSMSCIAYYGYYEQGVQRSPKMLRMAGTPTVFGTLAYSYVCSQIAFPLRASLKKRQFAVVSNVSIYLVAVIYGAIGLLGPLAYASDTKDIVTNNLPANSTLVKVVKLSLCVVVFVSFIVQAFPIAAILDDALLFLLARHHRQEQRRRGVDSDGDDNDDSKWLATHVSARRVWWMGTIVRAGIVVFTVGITMSVSSFSLVVSFIGSFSNAAIGFIFPAAFYLKLCNARSPLAWVIVVVGIMASVVGVIFSIKQAIK